MITYGALAATIIRLRADHSSVEISTALETLMDSHLCTVGITGLGPDKAGRAQAMAAAPDANDAIREALVSALCLAGYPVPEADEPASQEEVMVAQVTPDQPAPPKHATMAEADAAAAVVTPARTKAAELFADDPKPSTTVVDRTTGEILGIRALASQQAAVYQMAGQLLGKTKDDVDQWVGEEHGGRGISDLTRKEATMFVERIRDIRKAELAASSG